jgi:mediator of RNA polymerase II transcription subunit 21
VDDDELDGEGFAMDIITQLQEQLSEIAMLTVNTFGTLQRDAPPDRLSTSYPDPLNPNPKPEEDAKPQVGAPAPAQAQAQPPAPPQPPALDLAEQPKAMSHALVLAAKKVQYSTLPPLTSWSRLNARTGTPR